MLLFNQLPISKVIAPGIKYCVILDHRDQISLAKDCFKYFVLIPLKKAAGWALKPSMALDNNSSSHSITEYNIAGWEGRGRVTAVRIQEYLYFVQQWQCLWLKLTSEVQHLRCACGHPACGNECGARYSLTRLMRPHPPNASTFLNQVEWWNYSERWACSSSIRFAKLNDPILIRE